MAEENEKLKGEPSRTQDPARQDPKKEGSAEPKKVLPPENITLRENQEPSRGPDKMGRK